MRSTRSRRRLGQLIALVATILVLAACTDDGTDVRSPAPTGSLTPASTAGASASPAAGGDLGGDGTSAATVSGGALVHLP